MIFLKNASLKADMSEINGDKDFVENNELVFCQIRYFSSGTTFVKNLYVWCRKI